MNEPDDKEDEFERNPLVLPTLAAPQRIIGCPVCKHPDYNGRRIQGVITWTCANPKCGNKWQGGIAREPIDPTLPMPPIDPRDQPSVSYTIDRNGKATEQRRHVNTTQEFRKGLPIPEGDE